MNIFELDQRQAAEAPHFVHLELPNGKKLYLPNGDGGEDTSKPIGVEIVGAQSALGRKYRNRKAARIVLQQKKNGNKDFSEEEIEQLVAEAADANDGDIAEICTGWRNFHDENGPREFDRDELRDLLRRNPAFSEQIEEAHMDAANFLTNGSGG